MKVPKSISKSAAKKIGDAIGVDWKKVDIDEFRKGIKVEFEHGSQLGPQTNVTGDNLEKTARIALAHLKELPNYYTKLAKIEENKMNVKQLRKLVENIVKEELCDEESPRRSSHPSFAPDGALSKDELEAALQRQREKKIRMDAQRKRAAIKSDLREEEDLCEQFDRTDEAVQLLKQLLPEARSLFQKVQELETILASSPGTKNIRGAAEYHSEQLASALGALSKKLQGAR